MSGSSGPRVRFWLDKSPAHNDPVLAGGPYPVPGTETEFLDGLEFANNALPFIADTGDGTSGVMMVDDDTFAGCGIDFPHDDTGCHVGPLQPDSVVFMVVQRMALTMPNKESFAGLLPQQEGYAAPYIGTLETVLPAPGGDPTQVRFQIPFGSDHAAFGGGPGYAIALGDGSAIGWGVFMEDNASYQEGFGSRIVPADGPHLLTLVVENNNQITLYTDGSAEHLTVSSAGQGAPTQFDPFGARMGFSATHIFAGPASQRDAVVLKAIKVYSGVLSAGQLQLEWNYFKAKYHTP